MATRYEEDIKKIHKRSTKHENVLVIFAGIAFELEEIGPTFANLNPCPSLPSVATDGMKKFNA